MNILIITPFYKQDRNIASVRWTNISQRLAQRHNIIVVTQPLNNDMDMSFSKAYEDGIIVARMNQKTGYEKVAVRLMHGATGDDWQTAGSADTINQEKTDSIIRRIKNTVFYSSMQIKAKSYAKQICNEVIPKDMKIDVVISSACPFIEMLFGYEVKKLLGCKWISDFRDWPYRDPNCVNHDQLLMKNILRKSLRQADRVFLVTKMAREIAMKEADYPLDRIMTIRNGYSIQDKYAPFQTNPGILKIVHTGSLYGGKCKSDLLFAAIRKLQDRSSKTKIIVECAGGNNESMTQTAKKYGVLDSLMDRGFLPRQEALELQNNADCLLSIIVNNPFGGFNAKLLEYMLWDKPIINIAIGNSLYGEATQLVNELRLGIAVEEEKWDQDVERLAQYLELQADRKKHGRKLEFSPDKEKIKQYDYDVIAKQVEQVCISLIKEV